MCERPWQWHGSLGNGEILRSHYIGTIELSGKGERLGWRLFELTPLPYNKIFKSITMAAVYFREKFPFKNIFPTSKLRKHLEIDIKIRFSILPL